MEAYLPQNLNSLITSNIDDVEILIINDGSKDRTSEIGHEYERRYPNSIRIIDKANGHYGSCVNCGVANATGKYIKILDADDSFDTQNFEEFVTFLKESDADMVLSAFSFVSPDGIVFRTKKFNTSGNHRNLSFEDGLHLLIDDLLEMHSITYKLSVVREMQYRQLEGIAYTDIQWRFTPMLNVNSISCFNKVIYRYLVGRDGQSVDEETFNRSIKEHLLLADELLTQYAAYLPQISTCQKIYAGSDILRLMQFLYKNVLSLREHDKYYSRLFALDQRLKQINSDLYREAGRIRISSSINYPFIEYWRSKYSRQQRMPLISLYRLILKLQKAIKSR